MVGTNQINFIKNDGNQTAWKDLQDDSTLLDPSSEDGNQRMKSNADKKKENRKNVEKVKESEDDFAFSIIKESGHFKLLDSEGEIKLVNMTLCKNAKL